MGQTSSSSTSVLQEAVVTYKTKICNNNKRQQHSSQDQDGGGGGEETTTTFSSWFVPNPHVDDIRKFIGISFAGTESVVGEPFGTWSRSHIGNWYTLNHHAAMVAFGLGIPIQMAFAKQSLILAKYVSASVSSTTTTATTANANSDKNNNNNILSTTTSQKRNEEKQQQLVAAAVVMEVDKKRETTFLGQLWETWLFLCGLVKNFIADGGWRAIGWKMIYHHRHEFLGFGQKISAAMESVEPHHPTDVHWYVLVMGTHPDYQKQGHGAEVMNHIAALADDANRTCFLECGDTNRDFYDKMGYQLVSSQVVQDPFDTKGEPLRTYAMVRPPNKKAAAIKKKPKDE